MRKIINFDKQLEFPSMIGEITSISLDQNLAFKDESNIEGSLLVKGTYKRTEASRLEEEFSFDIPTEIIMTERLDLTTTSIEIDDFYYEIEKEDTINCHISILVEGMEIIDIDDNIELENHETVISNIEERECDGDNTYEETYEEPKQELIESEKEEIMSEITEEKKDAEDVGSLFTSLKDSEETYSTYSVYIVRKEETLESILSKFKITKEDLESYNDIKDIGIGSKLIIPMNE